MKCRAWMRGRVQWGAGATVVTIAAMLALFTGSPATAQPCGELSDLGTIGGPQYSVLATGVSADGQVVIGYNYNTPTSVARAFRWSAGEGMQTLGTLGTNGDMPFKVSANGQAIFGLSSLDTGTAVFRWTPSTGMQLLPGTSNLTLGGVSADGTLIVGTSIGDGIVRAFRWTETSGIVLLGTLGGS
jgi:probable HAF family extracellular repeat protein